MKKESGAILELTADIFRTGADLISGRLPKPEKLVRPRMKQLAKGIGDIAIFGWNSKRK